ncbi:MAG TPA: hypothetical protein VKZ95_08760 [Sphingobacteriaceae bacterium]|nr:hypothetical protein [Sphingobacteriaceae bacterium]
MKKYQETAPNSTGSEGTSYDSGHDKGRLNSQDMPNTRMNGYITNRYAGPVKGGQMPLKEKHREEKLHGGDYGV